MCKYSAFNTAPNSNFSVSTLLSKWLPNSNCETKVGGDASLLSLNFVCCYFVFTTFSVFKVVYHEYPFAFSAVSVTA